MIRLMVTSATYRQSSNARPELTARDPENTLLARQSRLRLPAELIRDQALSAAALLDLRIGGPSVKPPQPKGVAELSYGEQREVGGEHRPDRYRRGLYILFQRTVPYPQLMNFDAPNANLSCTRRDAPTRRCRRSTCSTTPSSSKPRRGWRSASCGNRAAGSATA